MDWQTLGMVSGTVLLAGSALQTLEAAYVKRRRLRRAEGSCARQRHAFDQQLQAVLQWARAARPVFKAWTGTREFRVGAVVDESIHCKSFYLVPADGRPLPRFEPGQYLTFGLPLDPHQKPLVRCYSLSDKPREDYYRVTIKFAHPPAGQAHLPPGASSNYFHNRLRVGGKLDVQAPQGSFFLDPTDDQPTVLIGGGIGITPLVSMANAIAHEGRNRTTYVFGGFGNSREHPFLEHLRELDATHENLHFDFSYSRPLPSDQVGRDYQHRGRIDLNYLRQVLPSNNFRFYVCGPAGMMESLVPALLDWGVPEEHIRYEAFGPASVKRLSHARTAEALGATPCNVELSLSETRLTWNGSHESLLDFAESQGVSLDYGCRAGNCGQCLVKVREGCVAHVKQPGLPLGENECLTCIGVPQSDVVLEA